MHSFASSRLALRGPPRNPHLNLSPFGKGRGELLVPYLQSPIQDGRVASFWSRYLHDRSKTESTSCAGAVLLSLVDLYESNRVCQHLRNLQKAEVAARRNACRVDSTVASRIHQKADARLGWERFHLFGRSRRIPERVREGSVTGRDWRTIYARSGGRRKFAATRNSLERHQ